MKIQQGNSYDVVVCGGGPAGIMAAIAAARNKAKVLLVESDKTLGSVLTMGIIPHGYYSLKGQQAVKGLPQELIDRLKAIGGAIGHVPEGNRYYAVTPTDQSLMLAMISQMLDEEGVDVLTGTLVMDAVYEKSSLRGVILASKDGLRMIPAKVVVDATGDGDVAVAAGAAYEKGNDKGHLQPVSLCFRLTNVDIERFMEQVEIEGKPAMGIKPGKKEESPVYFSANYSRQPEFASLFYGDSNHHFTCNTLWAHDLNFNAAFIPNVDGTDAVSLSKAEVFARRQISDIWQLMRKTIPAVADSTLLMAHRVSIRETRRVAGDYMISDDDMKHGSKFDDGVAFASNPMDIHDPVTGRVVLTPIGGDAICEIPYRSMLPRGVEGIILAGRNISASIMANASVRVMPACMSMGQAAGIAAALSAAKNITPRQIDGTEIKKRVLAAY